MKNTGFFTGLWWLPERPDKKQYGSLTIDSEGKANLLLFEKPNMDSPLEFDNYNQITGLAFNHEEKKDYTIELINAWQTHFNTQELNKYGYLSTEYLIYKGNSDSTPLRFKEIILYSEAVNEWIQPTGIKSSKENRKPFNISFKYTQPKAIKFYQDEQMRIGCFFNGHYSLGKKGEAIINESKWISVELKQDIALDDFHKLVSSLENLFTLVLKGQIMFSSIKLKALNGVEYQHYVAGRKENFLVNKSSRKGVDFYSFKEGSQTIFENWFLKSDELRMVINNFFTAFGNLTMYMENRFIAYISLLEQYHSLRFIDFNPKGETYKRMYEKVLSSLKGDSLSWVKKRLDDKTEINLRSRLDDLMKKDVLHIDNDQLNRIIETRNYLVHLDPSKENILNNKEMMDINSLLEKDIIQLFHKEFVINVNPNVLMK